MLEAMKGYEIKGISKRKANKEDFGAGLNEAVPQEVLREEVLNALEGKGKVFSLYSRKEKKMAACYILEKVKVKNSEAPYQKIELTTDNIWEFIKTGTVKDAENEESSGKKDKETAIEIEEANEEIFAYHLTGQYSAGVSEEAVAIFEKCILAELREQVAANQIDADALGLKSPVAIIWKDTILRTSKVKAGSFGYINAVPLGLGVGVALGVALDNLALGISLGFLWAIVFGVAFTKVGTSKDNMPILTEKENVKKK